MNVDCQVQKCFSCFFNKYLIRRARKCFVAIDFGLKDMLEEVYHVLEHVIYEIFVKR